ncbi:MAG TPA: hypothetical protein PKE45_05595 [Caldilineaceae bacterium]|nr:hypothetical protein [Caldilineaceae bacterium]
MSRTGSIRSEQIHFANGRVALAFFPGPAAAAQTIIDRLALPSPRGLVVLNGGTTRLEPAMQQRLTATLQDGLARAVAEEGLMAVNGGTDAGVFQLFGQGRARWGDRSPSVGVAVADLVSWPGQAGGEAPLEPHQSHFVLGAGKHWGAETSTMYALVATWSQQCPSVAVFAGGGEITIREMQMNVAQSRPLVLLAGSGRATDAVLDARAGKPVEDARLTEIAERGQISAFDLAAHPATLAVLIRQTLLL